MQFSIQVTIRRPVQDVFSFAADLRNAPRWNTLKQLLERGTG